MTQTHPIMPPDELVQQWASESLARQHLCTQAARWGADQELEACCEYIKRWFANPQYRIAELRDARRPKPLSDKEQALEALERINRHIIQQMRGYVIYDELKTYANTILKALEALND